MKITDASGTVVLRNGVAMPYLGLGVYLAREGGELETAIQTALQAGYRHIDTAAFYGNEAGVGRAVAESGFPRSDVFITSKVWNSDQGYDNTLRAFDASLKKFKFDYLDLYLVHWPVGGKFRDTWKALERLYQQKVVRAIGVSNFLRHHLEDLLASCHEVPMVNQMEFHPYLVQQDLIDFCQGLGIQYESWSPLMQGKIVAIPELQALATTYGKNVAQLTLRWSLQKGVATIPKSVHPERIVSNAAIFDFVISESDMKAIDGLDRHERMGPDPDDFHF